MFSITAAVASGTTTVIGNITGVETIRVTNGDVGTYAINMLGSTGATELVSRLSSGNVSFTNVQAAATTTAYATTGGTVTATYLNSLAAGTADSATVKVDGGATSTFDVKGTGTGVFETVNIQSAGSTKNTVSFASTTEAGAKTFVLTGSADTDLSLTLPAAKSSIDASAATGAVKITLTDDTSTASSGQNVDMIKTGSGNDTLDVTAVVTSTDNTGTNILGFFDGASATSGTNNSNKKTVDLGAGTNTLVINEDLVTLAATAATDGSAQTHSVTGVTNLVLKQGASQDNAINAAAIAGVSTVEVKASAGDDDNTDDLDVITITKLTSAQTVKITDAAGASVTDGTQVSVALTTATGTADSVNVTLNNTAAGKVLGVLTVAQTSSADVETLNLVSTGTSTNKLSKLDAGNTTTAAITGDKGLTIELVDLKDPANSLDGLTINRGTVDSTGLTGGLTLGTSSADFKVTDGDEVAVKLGAGTNKVYAGAALTDNDTVTGTTGTDTLYVTALASGATLKTTVDNIDNVIVTSDASNVGIIDTSKFASVGKIQLVDGGAGITLSKLASGQAVDIKSTTATTADFTGNTVTLTNATGVTSASVSLSGTVAFGGAVSTNATSLTVTDNAADATYSKPINNRVVLNETSGKVTTLTVVGGGKTASVTPTNSVFTVEGDGGSTAKLATLDATGYAGDITLGGNLDLATTAAAIKLGNAGTTLTVRAADLARDAIVVTGGTGIDTIVAADLVAGTYRPGATSVEVLGLETDGTAQTGAVVIDLTDAASVATVSLNTTTASDENITIQNSASALTLKTNGTFGTGSGDVVVVDDATSVTVVTGDTTVLSNGGLTLGDATSASFKLNSSAANASTAELTVAVLTASVATSLTVGGSDVDALGDAYVGKIDIADVSAAALTSLTINASQGDVSFGATGLSAAKLATVTVTGDEDVVFGGNTGSSTAALAAFNASAATGNVTIGQSVDFTTSADIKTGSGDDTVWMNIQDFGGVTIDAGSQSLGGRDVLNLQGTANLGLTVVDLSSTTDQVTQANGSINSAIQKGFESVDLSALTGSFGANITGSSGANTIVGTANADNIVAGEGGDTITGGQGADTINLTEATAKSDIVKFATGDTTASAMDLVSGFATNSDVISSVGNIASGIRTAATLQSAASAVDVKSATTEADTTVLGAITSAGKITVSGADAGNVNTLGEWIDVAKLMLSSATGITTGDTASSIGFFEFNGSTYVVEETTTDVAATETVTWSVIQLDALTSVTGLATTAAAGYITIA